MYFLLCCSREVHNITHEIFLPKKIEPECNQASRSNHQFTGNRGDRDKIVPQEAISQLQNVRMSHRTNDPVSPTNQRHEEKRRSGGGGGRRLLDIREI